MNYDFEKKVKGYFEVELSKVLSELKKEENGDNIAEIVGAITGTFINGMSVILQDYHKELVKEIPNIAAKSFMKKMPRF